MTFPSETEKKKEKPRTNPAAACQAVLEGTKEMLGLAPGEPPTSSTLQLTSQEMQDL